MSEFKKWAILIPYTLDRFSMTKKLVYDIDEEGENEVYVISELNTGKQTIGAYRNKMLQMASDLGFDYVSFFDSDDNSYCIQNYLTQGLKAIEQGVDVCELRGEYYENGVFKGVFEHSTKYDKWATIEGGKDNEKRFIRPPNHLNIIKTSIAAKIGYKDLNFGEDFDYSMRLLESGLVKTEYSLPPNCITYKYSKKC